MKYVVQVWDVYDNKFPVIDSYETDDYSDACSFALELKHYYDSYGLTYVAIVAEKFKLENEEDL